MSDFMEVGDLIPQPDGWWKDKSTGNMIDPDGRVYDVSGEMIFDPDDDAYTV